VLNVRVIPVLLLKNTGLVKSVKFNSPVYLGDPRNAVKIFNEKQVDELLLLDIDVTISRQRPNFKLIKEIVSEAFMPVSYGGGIRSIDDAIEIFSLGVEKIVVNSYSVENPSFITELNKIFGAQSISVCIDVKRDFFGRYNICTHSGRKSFKVDPVIFSRKMEQMGAGEIIINSIDLDGTMNGFDLELIKNVSSSVNLPVVACGGAGSLKHLADAVKIGSASAVAAGSMFVFHGRHRAVLINYPDQNILNKLFN
jgi:cyclase